MSNRKVIVGFREGDAFKQDIDLTEEFQKLEAEIAELKKQIDEMRNRWVKKNLTLIKELKELKKEIISLGKSYRYLQNKCESQRAEIAELIARCKGLVDLVVYLKNENTEHKARWEELEKWREERGGYLDYHGLCRKMQQLSFGGEVDDAGADKIMPSRLSETPKPKKEMKG